MNTHHPKGITTLSAIVFACLLGIISALCLILIKPAEEKAAWLAQKLQSAQTRIGEKTTPSPDPNGHYRAEQTEDLLHRALSQTPLDPALWAHAIDFHARAGHRQKAQAALKIFNQLSAREKPAKNARGERQAP
ncbi:MAG: hypothetical protein IT559_03385 [Alphaproteobacteria bacterium]|nr:hypothetical protein [Alphaproteobacteria bacterium]